MVLLFTTLIYALVPVVPQTTPVAGPSPAAIIQFLNQTIAWYRQLDAQRLVSTEPNDVLQVNENQQIANQTVWLAFEFARAEADVIEKRATAKQTESQSPSSSRYLALQQLSAKLDQEVRETRAEVDSLRQKLATTAGRQLQVLKMQIAETQSELDLAQAHKDALRSMVEFVGGSSTDGLGASGLRGEIETLARSVPAALTKSLTSQENASPAGEQTYPPPAALARKAEPSGVWGLASDLLALSREMHILAQTSQLTDSLTQVSRELRSPLVNRLREMSKLGDELAKQADLADQSTLFQEKKQLDALTAEFKQTSACVLPLSKQSVLLNLYRRNLTNWQSTLESQFSAALRSLLLKVAFFVVLLAVVIVAAELWRRTIFRYVRDARRRYQFLLLRKIVLWCVIATVLVFAFANELGSVATFAGLITAGVAVALQNVILSIVGYFFLIGKFGIRVGDRVQVAGVTGEVVDVGLVRFHLLEVVSGGGKIPSGRVVAFSNSVVFQSTAGFFKQIPGTSFTWHEITLTLSSSGDYGSVEDRLRGVVEAVFAEYREEMERQDRLMERTLAATPVDALRPKSRLRFTQSGLELVIGYPVALMNSADIDARVTRELLKALDREPELKLAGADTPAIRVKTDPSAPDAISR